MDTGRHSFWARAAVAVCGMALAGGLMAAPYPETVEEGFVSLFNGKDLTGWEGATAMYGVNPKEPGVLQCFPDRKLPKGQRGDLVTVKEYGNFVLRFEFQMPPNGNNGLGLRIDKPNADAAYHAMCEVQLLDDGGPWYYDEAAKKDKLKPYQFTGSAYGILPCKRDNVGKMNAGKAKECAPGGSYLRKAGKWNFMEVRAIGTELEVYLNGYLITKGDMAAFKGDGDTPDGHPHPGLHNRRGKLGWLGHGHNVKWRNIRIKELPDGAKMGDVCPATPTPEGFTPCFTGKADDLSAHWKGVTTEGGFDNPIVRQRATPEKRAEMQAKADALVPQHWHVRNGTLFFDGFKGGYSLATKRDYKDFELWADWRLLAENGDSGLYLRGSPQVQIWDARLYGGSGGLYNNQKHPSKPLVSADRQVGDWNRFYVRMVGDKVTVRLNGQTVVDNVPLENYWNRKQPIFPIGQIELQCHGDPIEWRNIFIREL